MKAERELWGKDSVVEETVSDAIADIGPKLTIHSEAARENEGNAPFQRSSRRLKHRTEGFLLSS